MRPPGTTDARAPSAPAAMADARSADASLGAFLGSLPRDVLARHVLARLDPADLALFARAGRACASILRDVGVPVPRLTLAGVARHPRLLAWALDEAGCPADHRVVVAAAAGDHLDSLIWARDRGLPTTHPTACRRAAERGSLAALAFLFGGAKTTECSRHGASERITSADAATSSDDPGLPRACAALAARGGHVDVLRWLAASFPSEVTLGASECAAAAGAGRLETLAFLVDEQGATPNALAFEAAARGGHVAAMAWLRARGFSVPGEERACAYAARGGHVEALEWARAMGMPWDRETCKAAARSGRLDVLRWLRRNGCPWDEWTCVYAERAGHAHVARWARENGCPG